LSGKGDVFGDAFYAENAESAIGHSESHVRALTYCDMHSIKRDALLRVLRFYETFACSFQKKLKLTFNLRQLVSSSQLGMGWRTIFIFFWKSYRSYRVSPAYNKWISDFVLYCVLPLRHIGWVLAKGDLLPTFNR